MTRPRWFGPATIPIPPAERKDTRAALPTHGITPDSARLAGWPVRGNGTALPPTRSRAEVDAGRREVLGPGNAPRISGGLDHPPGHVLIDPEGAVRHPVGRRPGEGAVAPRVQAAEPPGPGPRAEPDEHHAA